MTPEESDRMNWLCRQITDEQDPKKFSELVRELDQLFARKEHRLESREKPIEIREPLICSICNEPIRLETAKVDENGKAVHEDCYIKRLLASHRDPPNPQHTE